MREGNLPSDLLVDEMRSFLFRLDSLAQLKQTENLSAEVRRSIKLLDDIQSAVELQRTSTLLELEPVNLAEICDDVCHALERDGYQAQHRYSRRKMALSNRRYLKMSIENITAAVVDLSPSNNVILKSGTQGTALDFGVYTDQFKFASADLRRFRRLLVDSRRPLPQSNLAALHIYVASTLLESLGSKMRTAIWSGRRGFSAKINPSEQLSLISL